MQMRSLVTSATLLALPLLFVACSNEVSNSPEPAPADRAPVGNANQPVAPSVQDLADDVRLDGPTLEVPPSRSAAKHLGHGADKALSEMQRFDKAKALENVQTRDAVRAGLRPQGTARAEASPEYLRKQADYLARWREIPADLPPERAEAQRAALKRSVLGE